jgi:dihydroorotase
MTSSLRATVLINARLIDPETGYDGAGGVVVEGGQIRDFGPHINAHTRTEGARLIDCGGDVVSPGLIDLRAFVGEPGAEHRETIASASAAAAAGGVTTIIAMPDTQPPVDDPAVVDFLIRRARDIGKVRVLPAAALTKGLQGREISEIGLLKAAGAVAFTDGSASIRNSQVMRRALTYARDFDALIIHYAEDRDLVGNGVMNEGELASRLGLPGIPCEAETIILERDLRLVGLTRSRYHAALITNRMSLDVLQRATAGGVAVTCSTSINHLTLNENDIGDYRTFLKLAPPLRGEDERNALVEAVASGLIDTIVSDHNPQDVETKRLPFAEAANGAIGLETMLAAALRLVHAGAISLPKLLAAMTVRPAQILRLPQGRLAKSAPADLIRFDPDEPFIVDPARLHSRCRNTPFDEARLQGVVKMTMVAGAIVYG